MTLPKLDAFVAYWKINPPVHQLVAAYMDYKEPEPVRSADENLAALIAAMGGGS